MRNLNPDKTFTKFFFDIDYRGETNSNGDIKTYIDEEALNQAFKLWIAESKGERLRTNSGGYLLRHLQKPMNEERARTIERAIKVGLSQDFSPYISVIELTVTPLYKEKKWDIQLIAYVNLLKRAVLIQEKVNNLI